MLPNVRLLIGALFITVLVLSCEFGVFAALRVNREPLSRLTSESAPLQLVAGKNAALAVPISWSAPRNAQTAAGGMPTGAIIVEVPVSQTAVRIIEVPAPSNDSATGTLDNDNQTNPATLQTALAPSPAAAAPAAPIVDAAPIAEAPNPLQETLAPAADAAAGNGPPEQTAAAPMALAAASPQQTPVAEIVKPAEAAPPQAASALQPNEAAAQTGEPPAAGAPVIAAIAPAAVEPAAAQPVEVTGSVPNAAMPETAAPKAKVPQVKPAPKIVHKPAAKKPHKTARAPTPPHHPVKKRIARARPAAAATAQPGTDFNNPVFQSAPAFQRPTKSRPGAKKTVTNNGFNTFGTFGTQFGTQ